LEAQALAGDARARGPDIAVVVPDELVETQSALVELGCAAVEMAGFQKGFLFCHHQAHLLRPLQWGPSSVATPVAEFDRETQRFDHVPADRIASIQRTPGRFIRAGQDVRLQCLDRLAVAESKYLVVHA